MRALVNFAGAPGSVELRTVPEPSIGPNEVLLKSRAVGVCGSDLHQWHGTQSWSVNWPVTLGHEFCGEVIDVGAEVSRFAPGDRVVSETAAYTCGSCSLCRAGLYNLCPERLGFGYGLDGAAAEYVRVRPHLLHRIPEGVNWEEAALTEPCSVAFNAVVQHSQPKPADVTVVLGPGPIGLLCTQLLAHTGPARLLIAGLPGDEHRLELARSMGADETILLDGEGERLTARVRDLGDGLGADLVVDATGHSASLRLALEAVRPEGQITKVGWGPQPLNFTLDPLVAKAARIQGSFSHNWNCWERVLQLMARKTLDVRPLVNRFPLDDWYNAFTRMDSREIPKAVLVP